MSTNPSRLSQAKEKISTWYKELSVQFRSIRYNSIEFRATAVRFSLHALDVLAVLALTIVIERKADDLGFESPHQLFVIGSDNTGAVFLNWPAIWVVIFTLVSLFLYWLVNIYRFMDPKSSSIEALDQISATQLEISLMSRKTAEIASLSTDDIAIDELRASIKSSLDSIDFMVQNFMDSVVEKNLVTSNLMLSINTESIDGRTRIALNRKFNNFFVYNDDKCVNDYVALLSLEVESPNSEANIQLGNVAFRVHPKMIYSIPGAGFAYHKGKDYAQQASREFELVAINDINKIQFTDPNNSPKALIEAAKKHFDSRQEIKSFVSIPLFRNKEVVGILNINSSDYYLGGRTKEQRAFLKTIIYPIIDPISEMAYHLRSKLYE